MERIVLREKFMNDSSFFERVKIGVVPASQGAGATFVATSLAKFLSEEPEVKISYIDVSEGREKGERFTYDALGMDKRFAGRRFDDFFEPAPEGKTLRGKINLDEGINWVLRLPKSDKNIKPELMGHLKRINNAPGDIILCDFQIQENLMELLAEMDVLLIVVDPLPSSLLGGMDITAALQKLEETGKQVIWIVNKMNPGIHKRELLKFLKKRDYVYLPAVGLELIYAAEYACMIPAGNRSIRQEIQHPFEKIIEILFG